MTAIRSCPKCNKYALVSTRSKKEYVCSGPSCDYVEPIAGAAPVDLAPPAPIKQPPKEEPVSKTVAPKTVSKSKPKKMTPAPVAAAPAPSTAPEPRAVPINQTNNIQVDVAAKDPDRWIAELDAKIQRKVKAKPGEKLSMRDAAVRVLDGNGSPMKVGDIWSAMLAKKLVAPSKGKTPEATLATVLLRSSIGSPCESQSTAKDFVRVAPGTFGLAAWNIKAMSPAATAKATDKPKKTAAAKTPATTEKPKNAKSTDPFATGARVRLTKDAPSSFFKLATYEELDSLVVRGKTGKDRIDVQAGANGIRLSINRAHLEVAS